MQWKYSVGFVLLVFTCMLGVQAKAESEQQYIVYLKQRASLFSVASEDLGKRYTVMDEAELAECLSSGMVEFYEPDYEIKLFEDFDSGGVSQWSLDAINVSKAWDIGCYGNEVKVAVIDSGAYAHPDLAPNLLDGHNYMDNNSDTTDNIGHGTYVSGIIVAECNNRDITGVAHRAKIIPLKCFDKGKSTQTSMISDAIYDAVDIYHADVINLSLGMDSSRITRTLQLSIKYAVKNNCIVVAAVGNDGTEMVYYPAKYDDVIGVGSINSDLGISGFSQHNTTVDVVAPGGAVKSVSIEGYTKDSGTSFACPQVSGMAAIAKCINKDITVAEFQTLLEETSTDLGNEGYDTYYGYGLINVEALIEKMLENTPVFMSPIDVQNAGVEITVYNNSDDLLEAVGIASEYENSILKDMKVTPIELESKGTTKLNCNIGNQVKFMLWDSFVGLRPLFPASEYRTEE